MNDATRGNAELDKWTVALKKREELQDLLRGVHALVQDGSIKLDSVEEVKNLLAVAQKELDHLEGRAQPMQDEGCRTTARSQPLLRGPDAFPRTRD